MKGRSIGELKIGADQDLSILVDAADILHLAEPREEFGGRRAGHQHIRHRATLGLQSETEGGPGDKGVFGFAVEPILVQAQRCYDSPSVWFCAGSKRQRHPSRSVCW